MALSKEFLKEARAAVDRDKLAEKKHDTQKNALDKQAEPIAQLLHRLRMLLPGRDGSIFAYKRSYHASGEQPALFIRGAYGRPETAADKQDKKNAFVIVIQKRSGRYEFLAGDFGGKPGQAEPELQRFDSAQQLADKFMGGWVGRAMPGAVAELEEQEKPRAQPYCTVSRYLNNLKHGR